MVSDVAVKIVTAKVAAGMNASEGQGEGNESKIVYGLDGNATDEVSAGMDMDKIKMIANDPEIMINDTVITGPADANAAITDAADADAGRGVTEN